ncbi:MAG TPA: Hsp20/alpha crystallin family protein [Nitrospirota bacterium]
MKRIKWDPFKDIMIVDDFPEPVSEPKVQPCTWSPAVDVYEKPDTVVLTAELPGVHLDDILLTVQENVISLKGERRFEKEVRKESFYRIERNYGYFCRRFQIPCDIETAQISATFEDGVLKVVVPKKSCEKKVEIKVEG